MKITEPLDTWLSSGLRDFAVPEAVGSSARVFSLDYEKAIRELFHAWVEMNWDRMDRSFLQFASWDPDRWGIVHLLSLIHISSHRPFNG